ncbi:FadR/GntR family transcriptional regulator [Nonomuraea helvata]|uniref:FadR/GntR family transcriptional regulator n=1 Tax=Nonomuraea helvata TaxID=37484 RepID=A0ABV5SKL5_9ACTN
MTADGGKKPSPESMTADAGKRPSPESMTAETGKTTPGALIAVLENRILMGHWAAGVRLPSERDLATEFAVSRPVIREVLRALQERGLIEVSPQRGSFVRRYTAENLMRPMYLAARAAGVTARQLMRARVMLETEAAGLAAVNATKRDRTDLLRVHQLFALSGDVHARARVDLTFHETIARASGNPVIHMMFTSIQDLTYGLMLRSLSDREVREAGEPLHTVILEHILDRDPDGAREAMRRHLGLAEEFYGPDMDANLAEVIEHRLASPATPSADDLMADLRSPS